jgi:hypothetical protein
MTLLTLQIYIYAFKYIVCCMLHMTREVKNKTNENSDFLFTLCSSFPAVFTILSHIFLLLSIFLLPFSSPFARHPNPPPLMPPPSPTFCASIPLTSFLAHLASAHLISGVPVAQPSLCKERRREKVMGEGGQVGY